MLIQKYEDNLHKEEVIDLWKSVFGYSDDRNDPSLCICKKLSVDNMIFVAIEDKRVVGTVMAGYDGHRGWIYSLAVNIEHRGKNIGSGLLAEAEKELKGLGCVKINLQILSSNKEVIDFYIKHGYKVEERISMGKEIPENIS